MNKNTYEAMEADTYKLVSFSSHLPAALVEKSPGVYEALLKGKLTISGTTKMIEIPIQLYKAQKGYTLEAEKDIHMVDYKIEPPTALFGTITTGETVDVIFNLTHNKL